MSEVALLGPNRVSIHIGCLPEGEDREVIEAACELLARGVLAEGATVMVDGRAYLNTLDGWIPRPAGYRPATRPQECSSGYCGWNPATGDPHTCRPPGLSEEDSP